MPSIRMLVVSTIAALAGSALFAGGCSGGSASSSCHAYCDKQYTCGDIDSVKADQCRNKCDADADVNEAYLDKCINKSDILSATNECLNRACSDYDKCLEATPRCKTGGSSSGDETTGGPSDPPPGGTACDIHSGSDHYCYESDSGSSCSGGTEVSACPQSNLLGSCEITEGDITLVEYFYDGGSLTADSAEQACESSGGAWSPG